MVDLETLGRGPGCRILSIGAVVMARDDEIVEAELPQFYLELDVNDQAGLTIDPETWAWWQQQSAEARGRLFNGGGKPGLAAALKSFGLWLNQLAPRDLKGNPRLCLWGNGADFDNAILQYAYAASGLPAPWPFWGNRCYRTLKSLAPTVKLVRKGTHHNALDDALSQAEHAHRVTDYLGVKWDDL
jgi:exodeoxyribonuclease VIII